MRVLHLDAGRSFRGGQRQLLLLASAQGAAPDLEVRVLAADRRLIRQLAEADVEARRWPGPGPRGLASLARDLRAFRPDLLHAHDARAQAALRLVGREPPLVVHRRIDDPPRRRRLTRWKYRRGHMICVSEAVRRVLLDFGIPPARLSVVRSAVPVPAAPPQRPSPAAPLRLLALGALVEHKGHAVLLEALARCATGPRLVLLGDGPLAGPLRRRAAALGLVDRVTFAGQAEPDWSTCDLFVHPSLTEGLGTAVLDAMAAGLPVLASSAGGLPELVRPGASGWLVPPGDPDALAAALDRVAGLPPDELLRLGRAGWERARAGHRIAAMVAATRAVYDRVRGGE